MDGRPRRESGRQNREPNEPRAGVSRPEMGERALETCGFRGVYARDLFGARGARRARFPGVALVGGRTDTPASRRPTPGKAPGVGGVVEENSMTENSQPWGVGFAEWFRERTGKDPVVRITPVRLSKTKSDAPSRPNETKSRRMRTRPHLRITPAMEVHLELIEESVEQAGVSLDLHDMVSLAATLEFFGTSWWLIKSQRRPASLVKARFTVVRCLYEYTDLSCTEVGQLVGGRDHTTILYATQQARKRGLLAPEFWEEEVRGYRRVES